MNEIRFECPQCKQSIEAPNELAGQLIDCPTCGQTIEVPVRPPIAKTPPPPPQAQPPPAQNCAPKPARRHGIFYYVFWGTISLFATLGILATGFVLLTVGVPNFFEGRRAALAYQAEHSTNSTAAKRPPRVNNLPALTDEEKQVAVRVMDNLKIDKDNIEGTTWYSPKSADGYRTAIYLYFGKNEMGAPWLRWVIRYHGDDWLFIESFRVKIDQKDAITVTPTARIKHDNSGGSVWETFDEPAKDHMPVLSQILAGEKTQLRM